MLDRPGPALRYLARDRAARGRVAGLLAASVLLLQASGAAAYCRTRTCEFDRRMLSDETVCPRDLETGCSERGPYVFWADACIPFAIQRDGSARDDIEPSTLEMLIAQGFETWSQVPCAGGGTPELSASSQGLTACDSVEYECTLGVDGNSNIIMFRDDFVDTEFGLRYGVIALTTLTANLGTGEIYDADLEINSRDEDFLVEGATGAGAERDLRGVINHELGHLLGLSHSRQIGALMREAYEGMTVPSDDDIAGICAALRVSDDDPVCIAPQVEADAGCVGSDLSCRVTRSAPQPRGCFCGAAGSGAAGSRAARMDPAGLGALAAGMLALWCRSRRRRSVL